MSMVLRAATLDAPRGPHRPIRAILTTSTKADDGYALDMEGADLKRYQRNPVLLNGHRQNELPVGRVEGIVVRQTYLDGELMFAKSDPVARRIEGLVRERVINAVSIGFNPRKVERSGRVPDWELLETSVVALPMDTAAEIYDRTLRDVERDRLDPDSAARLLAACRLPATPPASLEARIRKLLPGVLAELHKGR